MVKKKASGRRTRRTDAFVFTIRNSFLPHRFRFVVIPRVSTYRAVQICGATSLRGSPLWADKVTLLEDVIRIGPQTMRRWLSELPELGPLNRHAIA